MNAKKYPLSSVILAAALVLCLEAVVYVPLAVKGSLAARRASGRMEQRRHDLVKSLLVGQYVLAKDMADCFPDNDTQSLYETLLGFGKTKEEAMDLAVDLKFNMTVRYEPVSEVRRDVADERTR